MSNRTINQRRRVGKNSVIIILIYEAFGQSRQHSSLLDQLEMPFNKNVDSRSAVHYALALRDFL